MYVSLPPAKIHVALKPLPADPAAADDGVDSSTTVAAGAEEGTKSSMAGVKAAIAAAAAAAAAGAKSPMAGVNAAAGTVRGGLGVVDAKVGRQLETTVESDWLQRLKQKLIICFQVLLSVGWCKLKPVLRATGSCAQNLFYITKATGGVRLSMRFSRSPL